MALMEDYHNIDDVYSSITDEEAQLELAASIYLGQLYVAEHKGQIVGFMKATPNNSKHKKLGYIDKIYILPEYRKARLASGMIEHFKDICREAGTTRIHLATDMRSEAYAFWAKQGFKPFASRVHLEI